MITAILVPEFRSGEFLFLEITSCQNFLNPNTCGYEFSYCTLSTSLITYKHGNLPNLYPIIIGFCGSVKRTEILDLYSTHNMSFRMRYIFTVQR